MTAGPQQEPRHEGPPRRVFLAGAIFIGIGLAAYFILQSYWERQQPALKDPSVLLKALTQFTREKIARGQKVPASVSLNELVGAGYLKPEDAAAFNGVELTLYPAALGMSPRATIARARLADGSQVLLLADGTVQTTPK